MITNAEINDALGAVEDEVPVDTWTIDGISIWPLLRADIAIESYHAGRREPATPQPRRLADHFLVRPVAEITRTTAAYTRAMVEDPKGNARLREVDVILYSDGCSFVKLNGRYYERFCDPIRERLAARGKSTLLVTPLTRFHVPRHSPSLFVQPRIDVARIRARALASFAKHHAHLEGIERARAILLERLPAAAIRDVGYYAKLSSYVKSFQATYGRMFDKARPAMVFVVSYYGAEAMALIRECHSRGILTVDLQHGSISDAHWAYAGWKRIPKQGFDLLPHAFWVWSESERRVIAPWTEGRPSTPFTVVGGNPFLELWRDPDAPLVRAATERVLGVKSRFSAARHVIYTIQGFESANDLERLVRLVRESHGLFFWWVRMHPAALDKQPAIETALARAGVDSYVVDSGADIPLYGLLRHMDAHITESSTTVIEAAELGVPSVLLSLGESVMYNDLIDAGWATVADGADDVIAAISAQIARAPALRERTAEARRAGHPAIDDALDELFARVPARR